MHLYNTCLDTKIQWNTKRREDCRPTEYINSTFSTSVLQAAEFWRVYHTFRRHHLQSSPVALQRLDELLYAYGNASSSGVINKSRRWDFPGSFYFVGTIVSTIGKQIRRRLFEIPRVSFGVVQVNRNNGSVEHVPHFIATVPVPPFSVSFWKIYLLGQTSIQSLENNFATFAPYTP